MIMIAIVLCYAYDNDKCVIQSQCLVTLAVITKGYLLCYTCSNTTSKEQQSSDCMFYTHVLVKDSF